MANRTTHRSRTAAKFDSVLDKDGTFTDIQIYKRPHGQGIKRKVKTAKNIATKSVLVVQEYFRSPVRNGNPAGQTARP